MEKKWVSRELKSKKGSSAEPRSGLIVKEYVYPKDLEEFVEWANEVQSVTAIDSLNNIISHCKDVEADLAGQTYEVTGPSGLANTAKFEAELAIKYYEKDDILKAMQHAMSAVHNHSLMKFSLNFELAAIKGFEQDGNLGKGRPLGGQATKNKAETRDGFIRDFAVGFFKQNPAKTNSDCISEFLRKYSSGVKGIEDIEKLTRPTLIKKIKGCKQQALEELQNRG